MTILLLTSDMQSGEKNHLKALSFTNITRNKDLEQIKVCTTTCSGSNQLLFLAGTWRPSPGPLLCSWSLRGSCWQGARCLDYKLCSSWCNIFTRSSSLPFSRLSPLHASWSDIHACSHAWEHSCYGMGTWFCNISWRDRANVSHSCKQWYCL